MRKQKLSITFYIKKMISRKTASTLGELYSNIFRKYNSGGALGNGYYTVNNERLYDYLFEKEYEPWFCNTARVIHSSRSTRALKDFIMKLHTGETQAGATEKWTWQDRQKLGQKYLLKLAEDFLNYNIENAVGGEIVDNLKKCLELDGYIFKNNKLLKSEEDVLDVKEETGVLDQLYTELQLANKETVFHHLLLSEEHYHSNKWDDSISNSRKYLEGVLQEVAVSFSMRVKKNKIGENIYTHPAEVRNYLESQGLIEKKEKEAISSIYQLLSHTGGHPYMAQNDQARLLLTRALN